MNDILKTTFTHFNEIFGPQKEAPPPTYPGSLANDCKAAMEPSLSGVFQQFNEIFGTGGRKAEQALPAGPKEVC